MLNRTQRLIFGVLSTTIGALVAFLEGVAIFYYNEELGVSFEFLGLANFVIGALAAYTALVAGNISDRAKSKYRRKTYVLIFAPMFAFGVFLRMNPFTSRSFAPFYYTITYALQVVGSTGLDVVAQAWGVELATEVEERNKLYTVSAGCNFVGVFMGIILTLCPLWLAGSIAAILALTAMFAALIYLPDSTPMHKRAFIPTLCNIKSVLWNSQFRVYLGASTFMFFINTIPALLVFFIKYCLHYDADEAKAYYTMTVAAFVILGVSVLPFMKYILKTFGTLNAMRWTYICAAIMGILLFIASYVNVYFFVVIFGSAGMFSTVANVVLNIMNAEAVDYDELLCGKKRASSYAGVVTPVRLFIAIAGTSIPLALMSALGFTSSDDDKDDGTSTYASSLVLRIWCTLFLSFCFTMAYFIVLGYKIDETMHEEIVQLLKKRDQDIVSTDEIKQAQSGHKVEEAAEFEKANFMDILQDASTVEEETDVVVNRQIFHIIDPITRTLLAPPPYIMAVCAVDEYIKATNHHPAVQLSEDDQLTLRLLAYYVPKLFHMCTAARGRLTMLQLYVLETVISCAVFVLGLWQAVRVLSNDDEFGAYLVIVLTVIYSLYFCNQILFFKGIRIVSSLSNANDNLISALETISESLYSSTGSSTGVLTEEEDASSTQSTQKSEVEEQLLTYPEGNCPTCYNEYYLSVVNLCYRATVTIVLCILTFTFSYLAANQLLWSTN